MDVFSTILLILLATGLSSGAHFRGGTWHWKPIFTDHAVFGVRAEVTYLMTFNGFRDVNSPDITPQHDVCTEELKNNGVELGTRGYLTCEGCQPGTGPTTYPDMNWYCTDLSMEGNWDIGGKTFTVQPEEGTTKAVLSCQPGTGPTTYPDMNWYCTDLSMEGNWDIGGKTFTVQPEEGTTKVVLSYNHCCWVGPIENVYPYNNLGWRMTTEVDLSPRPDNGQINSSPISSPLPVSQFHQGCRYWLEIPVTDPDNDAYRCRYTSDNLNECYQGLNNGEMCGPLDYVTVYNNCTLVFDTTGPAGWYAVRVMIEDLDADGDPLSKISLSFLLRVDPDDSTCDTPVIVEPKRVCKTIPKDQVFEMTVIARAVTETLPIVRIETQKPISMTSLELLDVPGNPLQKSVTLTWTPTKKDKYLIGFNAVDKSGFSSSWSFVSLNVVDAVKPLYILRGDSSPTEGQLVDRFIEWSVQYNSRIKRPSKSAYITLLDDAGNIVDMLDSSIEQQVEFRSKMVVFNVNLDIKKFYGERTFTLRIDDGAALDESYQYCLLSALGDEWQIRVEGQSAPPSNSSLYSILVGPTLVFTALGLFIVWKRKKRSTERETISMTTTTAINSRGKEDQCCNADLIQPARLIMSKYETARSMLVIGEVIGNGAYGVVHKGYLMGPKEDVLVAVKSLKDYATCDMKDHFLDEIQLMIEIGNHPNILSILGCVTGSEPFYLITEFMKYGDLLSFLRRCKQPKFAIEDNIYHMTEMKQLQIARQIALGMEYISSTRYYHGDLAARNILVGEGLVVKIADFGMAEDIYAQEYKRLAPGKKRANKWVSLETNVEGKCTSMSDVWSYGIVLFEVVTLGDVPYPGMDPHTILHELKRGYRMEKPDNCSTEIYEIMKSCWQHDPETRPSIKALRTMIDNMIATNSDYLDMLENENGTDKPSGYVYMVTADVNK